MVQKQISVPFAIENITNRFQIPDTEISETEFISRVLHNTGCYMQLDLNNIDTNAYNYNFDAYAWIDQLPMDRIKSIHLAGGVLDDEGVLIDSHSAPVRDRVWELYKYVVDRTDLSSTIVEWTDDISNMHDLLKDRKTAEEIFNNRERSKPLPKEEERRQA